MLLRQSVFEGGGGGGGGHSLVIVWDSCLVTSVKHSWGFVCLACLMYGCCKLIAGSIPL